MAAQWLWMPLTDFSRAYRRKCWPLSCLPVVSSAAGTDYEAAAAGPPAAGSWGRWLRLERGSLLWAHQARKAPGSGSAGNAAGGREAPEAAAATESPAAERPRESQQLKLYVLRERESQSLVGNTNRREKNDMSFVVMISQSVSSTPACRWGAPPWEGSGWMVLACGAGLEVWRVRVAAEALQAAWACGTRLWRTSPACVATATTTWAWRTAAAVLHSGTWDQIKTSEGRMLNV